MRKRLSKHAARRAFSKTAAKTQSLNMRANPMRGGFRL